MMQRLSITDSNWSNITEINHSVIQTSHMVSTFALSPNGKYIASAGCSDYSIQIWDLNTGSLIEKPLAGHKEYINQINYSKCGNFIVSGGKDKRIRQWNLQLHQQIGQPLIGHEYDILGVDYSPDQRFIISYSIDQTIRFWDQKTGNEFIERRYQHHTYISCFSISPIHNQLAFGDQVRDQKLTIMIWNYEKSSIQRQYLKAFHLYETKIRYSRNGKYILQNNLMTIRIQDVQSKKSIRSFREAKNVFSVNYSHDQKYIIYCSTHNDKRFARLRIWDLQRGKLIGQSEINYITVHSQIQHSLCGQYFITSCFGTQMIKVRIAPTLSEIKAPD